MAMKAALEGVKDAGPMIEECDRRLCVRAYLGEYFPEPTKLLQAMSKSFVALSGSRSLNFFVPGCSRPASDWDFYIPSQYSIQPFMDAVEQIGVRWLEPIDYLEKLLRKGEGSMIVSTRTWLDMREQAMSHTIRFGRIMDVEDSLRENLIHIKLEHDNRIKITSTAKDTRYPSLDFLVQGEVSHRGKTQDIQLVVTTSDGDTPFDFLKGFHSTAVQSYITAHAACHMYGKMTDRDEMYEWPNIKRRFMHNIAAREKYRKRGFNPIPIPEHARGFHLRDGTDEECTSILGYNHVGAPDKIVDAYCMLSKGMVWNYTRRRMFMMSTDVYDDIITINYDEGWIFNAWYPSSDEGYDTDSGSVSSGARMMELWSQDN